MRMASPPTLDGSVWLKKVPIMVKRNSRMNGIDAPHWRTICCQRSVRKILLVLENDTLRVIDSGLI